MFDDAAFMATRHKQRPGSPREHFRVADLAKRSGAAT